MERSVETHEETGLARAGAADSGLELRLLGPIALRRGGADQPLPASRKVRGLLGYLALSPQPVSRSRLCDLLWDVANDPRGELRWCLSKLRALLDAPGQERVLVQGDAVALDLRGCAVDAAELATAFRRGLELLDLDALRHFSKLFAGTFLEGLEIERCPQFRNWMLSQRRSFHAGHASLLELLVARLPEGDDESLAAIERWVGIAPYDLRAQSALLRAMAKRGRIDEAEAQLAASTRLYEAEELDPAPLARAWQEIRGGGSCAVGENEPPAEDAAPPQMQRASLAVMPFHESGEGAGGIGAGLTHDIITRLAKLRQFFVIARGSVFALAERGIGPEEAGRRLKVEYVASGEIRRERGRITVTIELIETRTARIAWVESFERRLDDVLGVIDEIGDRIVASIASEIETIERNRAILKPPSSLSAWEAYHRGLWHMYRFTNAENLRARQFFETAIELDPTFARAHAGLSFTHWQSAFQNWENRAEETERAYAAASQSLLVDDHDPAAHWAMGRALWLRGRQDDSLSELTTAVDLSPNFALGHYALSFVQSQSGDPEAAIRASDHSRHLSPFDPLLFGMLGARAMSLARLGRHDEAADWALKAAARPNAHVIILAIAAHCLALAGRLEEGRAFAAAIRQSLPHYCTADFLSTFHFPEDAAKLFRDGARLIGLG